MSAIAPEAACPTTQPTAQRCAPPGRVRAQFKIGVRSMPALADHVVQGSLVLPGSFCIDMARCIEHGRLGRAAGPLRNVAFHRPKIGRASCRERV